MEIHNIDVYVFLFFMSRDVGERERFSRKRRKSLNFDDRIVYYFQSSNLKSFLYRIPF